MKRLLFITNGHGEDLVTAQIIRALGNGRIKIDVMPVVGSGIHFKGLRVKIIGPRKVLPSGGFGLRNYSFLVRDIFAGLLSKAMGQIALLRKRKDLYDLVVGVGDIVPLVYAVISGKKIVFIGINKSEYYKKLAFNYTGLEKWLLKKYSSLTFARDKKTADVLNVQGIRSVYLGNPMMDAVGSGASGQGLGARKTIGFLPGTREDAYKNIEDFFKIAWQIKKLNKKMRFVISVTNNLDKKRIAGIKRPFDIPFESDFGKVLSNSKIVIGLSGTGNEQAAGSGIPVISFPGRGAQYNHRFAKGQKELLGRALLLLSRNSLQIANEALALIRNKKRMHNMGLAGRQRMRGPGASKKIAEMIKKEIGA
jgi:hypothetical protein